jgi:hypothetical protein
MYRDLCASCRSPWADLARSTCDVISISVRLEFIAFSFDTFTFTTLRHLTIRHLIRTIQIDVRVLSTHLHLKTMMSVLLQNVGSASNRFVLCSSSSPSSFKDLFQRLRSTVSHVIRRLSAHSHPPSLTRTKTSNGAIFSVTFTVELISACNSQND